MRIEFKPPILIKNGETCEITANLNPEMTEVESCRCKITSPPEDHRPSLTAEFDVETKLVDDTKRRPGELMPGVFMTASQFAGLMLKYAPILDPDFDLHNVFRWLPSAIPENPLIVSPELKEAAERLLDNVEAQYHPSRRNPLFGFGEVHLPSPFCKNQSEEEYLVNHTYDGAAATNACCEPARDPNRERLYEVFIVTPKTRAIVLHEHTVAKDPEDAKFRAGVFSWLTANGLQPSDVNVIVVYLAGVEVANG